MKKKIEEEWAKSKKFAFTGMHTAQFLFLCHNRNEIKKRNNKRNKKRNKKQTNSGQNIFPRITYVEGVPKISRLD